MSKKTLFLTLIFNASQLVSQVSEGLVAKYSFNTGEFKDDLGLNHPKAYNVDIAEDRFGNAKKAVYLRGHAKSFLNLGTDKTLKPKVGSISIWANNMVIAAQGKGVESNPIIITRSNNGEDCCEAYAMAFGTVKPYKFTTAAQDSCHKAVVGWSLVKAQLGRWYHLVITFNDEYFSFYLDGKLQDKLEKNFETRFLTGDSVLIGLFSNVKNERYFTGYIDDIQMYNRVLTPAEVNQLYEAPNPNTNAIIIRWILIVLSVLTFVVLTIVFINNRIRKSVEVEREKHRLNARLIELETRAIRTQMNPHFVFNAMNALQGFILDDDKQKASVYLIEFSSLLRKLLESSEADTVSLKEEIDILGAYLKVEELRFDNLFSYEIISSLTQMENIYIPFMMVQPFSENAIWHGLLHKKGERRLKVSFSDIDEKRLLCEIDDNGVGRGYKSDTEKTAKKKSLAIDFTRQRLHLIKQATGIEGSIEIIDKKDEQGNSLGTTVKIIIPKSL